MDCLIENSLQAGIPYLETISSWRGAAESLIGSGPPYSKAADFLMIAGDREGAQRALLDGIRRLDEQEVVDQFGDRPELTKRLERYF